MPKIHEILQGDAEQSPIHIISLGAGVQSSTMALMAAHGEITPMPVAAIFADTQAEPESVYRWLDWLEKQLPFPVHRVIYKPDMAIIDKVFEWGFSQIPSFSRGGIGKRQCTKHWKIVQISKAGFKISNRKPFVEWIGISRDEVIRMKPSRYKRITHRWPLVEMDMTRQKCLWWMRLRNFPDPPRSACVFCPYQSNSEWRENRTHPLTVAIEQRCLERNEFLHRSMKPLSEADLRNDAERGQGDLFGNECEGMCGV